VSAPDGAVERRGGARRPHIPQRSAAFRQLVPEMSACLHDRATWNAAGGRTALGPKSGCEAWGMFIGTCRSQANACDNLDAAVQRDLTGRKAYSSIVCHWHTVGAARGRARD